MHIIIKGQKGLKAADKEKNRKNTKRALANILNMEKRLPEDFDP